ncbi:MAG: hypothetical protein O3B13_15005 [Planctomycetota bacterium]|nr:hypothetical protein [Planctomycetota bacterium]
MSRTESDREDLIREATALRSRIEWHIPGEYEFIVAGVRSNGSLSVYFGPDPVYQFSVDGGLRRAYVDGFLYRTQGETLARLSRQRSAAETVLNRSDLSPQALAEFFQRMDERLIRLAQFIVTGTAREIRSVNGGISPQYESLIQAAMIAVPRLAPPIRFRRH